MHATTHSCYHDSVPVEGVPSHLLVAVLRFQVLHRHLKQRLTFLQKVKFYIVISNKKNNNYNYITFNNSSLHFQVMRRRNEDNLHQTMVEKLSYRTNLCTFLLLFTDQFLLMSVSLRKYTFSNFKSLPLLLFCVVYFCYLEVGVHVYDDIVSLPAGRPGCRLFKWNAISKQQQSQD